MEHLTELKKRAVRIRKNIVKMVTKAKSGHPGGSLSAVEIVETIYFTQMDLHADNVFDTVRDKFVLSKGHASPVLYATLAEKGLIREEDLLDFRKLGSPLQACVWFRVSICRPVLWDKAFLRR